MRALIILTFLMGVPAFAEEIVEAAIYRTHSAHHSHITEIPPGVKALLGLRVGHAFAQQGRVLVDPDVNEGKNTGVARAHVDRLQRLIKKPPQRPQRSVIPELGGVVVLANTPIELELDLGGDVTIGIPQSQVLVLP